MKALAIAAVFVLAQTLSPAVASTTLAPGASKAAVTDLSAAKKKAKKKKKEKVQYMRSAS